MYHLNLVFASLLCVVYLKTNALVPLHILNVCTASHTGRINCGRKLLQYTRLHHLSLPSSLHYPPLQPPTPLPHAHKHKYSQTHLQCNGLALACLQVGFGQHGQLALNLHLLRETNEVLISLAASS